MPIKLHPLAEEANVIIRNTNEAVFEMLSERGRAIYFPKTGIVGQSAEAKGKRINATIGIALEDDGSPLRFRSIADKISLEPKDIFNYAPNHGKIELRKIWQESIRKKNPCLSSAISLPIVTQALTHGLSMAGYLFINPGDRIVLTDKFWGNYRLLFENAYGGELATFNTFKGNGFDIEGLKTAISEGTGPSFANPPAGEAGATAVKKKIILLNFPNNPAGYTPTEDEAEKIITAIGERAEAGDKLVVILDDAYFGLVYEAGVYQESLFSRLADLHKNVLAIKVDGATKEEYAWGLRVGFLTYGSKGATEDLYRALEDKTAGAIRGNVSNCSNLSQSLVLSALASPDYETEKKEKYDLLKKRFDKVKKILEAGRYADIITPLPFNSGYFMCIELAPGIEAETVRKLLLTEYSTGVIAMKNLLRLAYSAVAEKDLPELFENIYQACLDVKKIK
jgi:aspartate/methionine/tyrosine aminotransferase